LDLGIDVDRSPKMSPSSSEGKSTLGAVTGGGCGSHEPRAFPAFVFACLLVDAFGLGPCWRFSGTTSAVPSSSGGRSSTMASCQILALLRELHKEEFDLIESNFIVGAKWV